MANCPKCGEFMLPSCKKCGSDLIEKPVIRKVIKRLRSYHNDSQPTDFSAAMKVISYNEIADLLEKEIMP